MTIRYVHEPRNVACRIDISDTHVRATSKLERNMNSAKTRLLPNCELIKTLSPYECNCDSPGDSQDFVASIDLNDIDLGKLMAALQLQSI